MPSTARRLRPLPLRRAALRALAFAALWWVLTEGRGGGWTLASLFVTAATLTSLALLPAGPRHWNAPAAAGFALFFLKQALLGGLDVARRALHPALPIRPGLTEYRLRIRDEGARLLLLNTISLVPGTLSARVHGDRLLVHALDSSRAVAAQVAEIEERLARALGAELESPP